jgi:general secretion pathway protein A
MESQEGKMVNFIFFGLPDMDRVLSLDEPLKQRIAVRIRLKAFSEDNTREYIKHRLNVAGCASEIFTEAAVNQIFRYSNGSPRLINTICDNALLEGYLFKSPVIEESTIRAVAMDLGLETES